MKKIISILAALSVIFAVFGFCACGSKSEDPVVSFTADKTEAAPGESVTVTFNLKNCPYFACLSTETSYDESVLTYKNYKAYTSDDYVDMFNNAGTCIYYGYVATTEEITDSDILSITFTVNEDAESGSKAEITFNLSELRLGTDATGDEVYDVCENYEPITVSISIK